MPYTMTHLIIADKVSNVFSRHISNLPQFYLGNIAPDAVHNRANFTYDYKKDSHLCIGNEAWGKITDVDGWKNNAVSFLNNHKNSENHDFILGYCCHILSDICQYVALWTPFKQKYAGEIEKGIDKLLLHETIMIDIELALTHEKRDVFWSNIRQSAGIDLPGIIYAAEIEKQKDNILHIWYADKAQQDLTLNQVVTVEIIMDFIENAVDFVVLTLQDIL